MRISEAAAHTGLSVSNIRFYERKGLLSPTREEESRYRDYTEEDLARLKQIILYRKMNIPIETIFLLQNGEISVETVLRRQYNELVEQREMLQGSIDLCSRILKEQDPAHIDVDAYLNYVQVQEEQGSRFAPVEELLESVAEFSGLASFWSDPHIGRFLQRPGCMRALSFVLILLWIGLPASAILGKIIRSDPLTGQAAIIWGTWFLFLGYGFFCFRKAQKKHDRKDKQE